ncbi:bifunctional demethylmenaquinone methyltransferase/2-methoxy-6-polyprenyl-1,4-benzoquinol methylase UbiE [Prochlorococcus sp. MIT 1223]|uniref:bifunctional demethylmenaquinone methyltransferase/2-methoxy-6-polyprenyl-1,4-benzoquinol methylase UbiE n=1 Tax=Prochlorococcus sp. MIT 1223 TaxID=3096217 RepID=UPI002A74DBFF|nr:bifunctional demethylmenaquinone methyltransferase/2-methoxy-6-polyprenyl-1,4-benzoquinol methylase UbiE [Prochlorococcus sp. MIT 1223]
MYNYKKEFVKDIFNDISFKYDFLNDLFSLGLHRVWKRKLLSLLKPTPGQYWVDLCCGTGDLAINLANHVGPDGRIYGIDYAEKTLEIARKKCLNHPDLQIKWINNDILNDCDNFYTFDGVTMAYGLRNLSDPLMGFKIIRQYLKPGGKAGILDFQPSKDNSFSGYFQKIYLRNIVVPIASMFGFREQYGYIENSIKRFPNGYNQIILAEKAGFSSAKYYPIALDQMGILILKN